MIQGSPFKSILSVSLVCLIQIPTYIMLKLRGVYVFCHTRGKWWIVHHDDGAQDLFGNYVVHMAIAKMLHGVCYDKEEHVVLTIKQLMFFFMW